MLYDIIKEILIDAPLDFYMNKEESENNNGNTQELSYSEWKLLKEIESVVKKLLTDKNIICKIKKYREKNIFNK